MDQNEANSDTTEENMLAKHDFIVPHTKIKTIVDMQLWLKSQAHNDFVGFINALNQSVKGKSLSVQCEISKTVQALLDVLKMLSNWVDEIPPMEQAQRFGNKAFRTWIQKLRSNSVSLMQTVLPNHLQHACDEIADYLNESFGNATRIDYGTGHEAAFAAFLCCLCKIRVLKPEDHVPLVTKVFNEYLILARKLQKTYRMEPAGSQGVWGLDDFQFLPFIFGSSQLIMNERITPKDFVETSIVTQYHHDYMFLECIKYINEVKSGPFAEHSHTLWGISSVHHWTKVNSGLLKMYKAEVLQKFPVIQHFRFGSILTLSALK
uniref:Serine/threonine-protein phosphatase 2A activator n=1 Tax=Phallusia mammillata TaxID=59560 RepID=A0A6F9DQL0_9ASCI|nr:serine/threonine-protein phosphatase 2A activator-like [Phallusia mammillata]